MKTARLYTISLLTIILGAFSAFAPASTGNNPATSNSCAGPSDPEEQFQLGRAYDHGDGVAQSYELAFEWYRKAVDQGNPKAMNNLGLLFLEGNGTKKDSSEAYRLFHMAAEKGDSHAEFFCGKLLCEGNGVKQDLAEGMSWIRKSADQNFPPAMDWLTKDHYQPDIKNR